MILSFEFSHMIFFVFVCIFFLTDVFYFQSKLIANYVNLNTNMKFKYLKQHKCKINSVNQYSFFFYLVILYHEIKISIWHILNKDIFWCKKLLAERFFYNLMHLNAFIILHTFFNKTFNFFQTSIKEDNYYDSC